MNEWLCKRCFDLDGEALEEHIRAHARQSRWSYDEIRQAIYELRATAEHCPECKVLVTKDITARDLDEFHRVPLVRFDGKPMPQPLRGYTTGGRAMGRSKTMADAAAAMQQLLDAFKPTVDTLKRAGLLPPDPPSDDPKQRALDARKSRSTGPARPSGGKARRPRRHK